MQGLNIAQAIVTSVAIACIMTPLLILSFFAGRRSMGELRSHRLDLLRPELSLGGTTWRAEFAGDAAPDVEQIVVYEMIQSASRIVGQGQSSGGTRHILEGIIHQGRMCCITIDENRSGAWLGTVTAELVSGQQKLTGMRSRWDPQSQTMHVRAVTFTRIENAM